MGSSGGARGISNPYVGNIVVQDALIPTKDYALRTSGSNLDFDAAGSDMFLSVWSGVSDTGTQHTYARWESGTQLAHLIGRQLIATGPFAGTGVADLDPATGVASVGGKNSLAYIQLCGFKATAGAPTTGTWALGDVVLDGAGAWHLCTVAGTPGTWS